MMTLQRKCPLQPKKKKRLILRLKAMSHLLAPIKMTTTILALNRQTRMMTLQRECPLQLKKKKRLILRLKPMSHFLAPIKMTTTILALDRKLKMLAINTETDGKPLKKALDEEPNKTNGKP